MNFSKVQFRSEFNRFQIRFKESIRENQMGKLTFILILSLGLPALALTNSSQPFDDSLPSLGFDIGPMGQYPSSWIVWRSHRITLFDQLQSREIIITISGDCGIELVKTSLVKGTEKWGLLSDAVKSPEGSLHVTFEGLVKGTYKLTTYHHDADTFHPETFNLLIKDAHFNRVVAMLNP